jgi:hypothetical protein
VILGLSVATLLVALALDISEQGRVVIPIVDISLPGVCAYQQLTGQHCPGCGLTRCFVALAHGDAAGAWSYNAVGVVFFFVVLFQIPYRALQIWRLGRGRTALRLCGELWVIWPFLIALLTQWVIRSTLTFLV